MLVLTRRPQQALHLGKDIKITVVKVKGNQAILSIDCPDDIIVQRSEARDYFVEFYGTEDICYGTRKQNTHCGECIKCKFEEHLANKASE